MFEFVSVVLYFAARTTPISQQFRSRMYQDPELFFCKKDVLEKYFEKWVSQFFLGVEEDLGFLLRQGPRSTGIGVLPDSWNNSFRSTLSARGSTLSS